MVKRLKRKFVLISMISVIAVLFLIVGAINIVNYTNTVSSAGQRLSLIVDNGGKMPFDKDGEPGQMPGGRKMPNMSPEAPYEMRFFTVRLSWDGKVEQTDTGRIAAVSPESAGQYALSLFNKDKHSGFMGKYMYRSVEVDGGYMYAFLDCTRELDMFRSFLFVSLAISFAGLLLVCVLVMLLAPLAVKPVAESYEKQKRFITDAGHELKTPLAVISANTEVIEMESGENEWTRSVKRQVGRLASLTDRLVTLCRMEEQTVKPADFDISEAVRDCCEPYDAVGQASGKVLVCDIPFGVRYTGDEQSVRRALDMLLDNAFKYSRDGAQIKISLCEKGKKRIISLSNPAPDMPEGEHPELFERFYRPDGSRSTSTGSFGIGLSTVAAIADAHHGSVRAYSQSGIITFTMTLA